ncbi:MAG: 30S ribosome-binding factor RbfA [Pseudomonadales bacterium]|nr:30S ribosome-binding factor RbfA [Pseudomonadales bacterium]
MQGGRQQRVADQIQRELASFIQLELKDPRLNMVTVSGVDVSRDFSYADVYVTFMTSNDNEEAKELVGVLNNASGYLRKLLGKAIKLRITPNLRFHYDATLSSGAKMNVLIKKALEQDQHQHSDSHSASDIDTQKD